MIHMKVKQCHADHICRLRLLLWSAKLWVGTLWDADWHALEQTQEPRIDWGSNHVNNLCKADVG